MDIDLNNFQIKEKKIGGDECVLVNPSNQGCNWDCSNIIYRSSIWRKSDGFPVSLGYKKFFNFGIEHPEIEPFPNSLKNVILEEKLDGSLLIISKYKGELIIRTRGSFDIETLENKAEIYYLLEKYPTIIKDKWLRVDESCSFLFEFLSPTNQIVIKYPEPDLYFLNIIYHEDYSYASEDLLNDLSLELKVKRPKTYHFNSIDEMLKTVEIFKGIEGICAYYNNRQSIRKIKSAEYLVLHTFKSQCSLDSIIDLYFELEEPKYNEFIHKIQEKWDFECSQMARPFVSKIADSAKQVDKFMQSLSNFVEPLKNISRKEAAQTILSSYGPTTGRSSCAFTLLDSKLLSIRQKKKLLYQFI